MAKTLYTSLIYGFLIQFLCYIFKIQKKYIFFCLHRFFLLVFNNNNNFIVLYIVCWYRITLSLLGGDLRFYLVSLCLLHECFEYEYEYEYVYV